MTTSPLDATDLKMVRVALCYYVRAHELSKRPVPPAAARLAKNLEVALAVNGTEVVVPQAQLLTTTETAARLQCCERTARNIAKRVGRKSGRQWFIPLDALSTEE